MSEEGKDGHYSHHHHHHHRHDEEEEKQELPQQYETFQGVANYTPQPLIGFPQPVPPPGASDQPHYAHGYQAVPGYAVAEGTPVTVRERRLPCCGIGLGWFMFIIGFFLAAIPWYIAAFILLCAKIDPREKPGYHMHYCCCSCYNCNYFGCDKEGLVVLLQRVVQVQHGMMCMCLLPKATLYEFA